MTLPNAPEVAAPTLPPDASFQFKVSPAIRKLLASTPEKDWPRIRAFLVESEEEGELVDMLPEVNRVMKVCPARLMGRVGKREITADQLDKAYTLLHDSIHGVRQALHSPLHLAGVGGPRPTDSRPSAGDVPPGRKESAPAAKPAAAPLAPRPLVAPRTEKS